MRHRNYPRIKSTSGLSAFLAERADTLNGTGASKAFTAVQPTAATGVLTIGTNPLADATVTIDTTVYTFKASASAAYEVTIGADKDESAANLNAAINAGAGAGTLYGEDTAAHPSVSSAEGAGTTLDITALTAGAAGNSIATTETLADGSFGAATLTGGVSESNVLTASSHGFADGAGPFVLTTSDTLPAGLVEDTLYWVRSVPDANSLTLSTEPNGAVATVTDDGTGTHALVKADTAEAMLAHVKKNGAATVRAATDVDSL
jgi:hypothetical protein